MARKVCPKCKIFVLKSECPECGNKNLSTNWKGKMIILHPDKSEIAQKLEIKKKGEYAIKAR